MEMALTGALLGGGLFVAAGLYEMTPLKQRCLGHCRSPLEWLSASLCGPATLGALRMGAGARRSTASAAAGC